MKKIWYILIIVFIILIIGVVFSILRQKKQDTRSFKKVDFPKTILVQNGTEYNRADTIILVLADKIFNLDTLDIKVFHLPEIINEGEMEYYAIVQKLPFGQHQYLILLKRDMSLSKIKVTLSHEFVHIKQYEKGELIMDFNYAMWKGEKIVFKDVEYEKRPFEIEAFQTQGKITKELNKELYE